MNNETMNNGQMANAPMAAARERGSSGRVYELSDMTVGLLRDMLARMTANTPEGHLAIAQAMVELAPKAEGERRKDEEKQLRAQPA